jgi:hypothetical protein
MRIKKDNRTRNEYVFAGGMWVRNFTKSDAQWVNANKLVKERDHLTIIKNEVTNKTLGHPNIAEETFSASKMVIVSDGYKFDERHKILAKMTDVAVIAINRALVKWKLLDPFKPINAYLVNNPYSECLNYLPRKSKYYPICVASSRTNTDFLKQYQGNVYLYDPTPEVTFGYNRSERYFLDDYRNPVCAAVCLAHRLKAKKVMLMCCDDSFEDERAAAEKLPNGLWTYPQHMKCHEIVDANLYWLTHQEDNEVKVADFSSGPKYNNAAYIDSEEAALSFFADDAVDKV